jgi:replicative DNA helicase
MFNIFKYIEENPKVGIFGIKYLDDRLRGILKGDLILIGARPGAGKSTIAKNIALANTCKVKLFSLENFDGDDMATDIYLEYMKLTRKFDLNLRDFVSGNFEIDIHLLEQAQENTMKKYANVSIVSRQKNYTIDRVRDDIKKAAHEGIQLIILDHLDYVDKFNAGDNENVHMTALMKTIREAQDEQKCAFVAISHLRKATNSKNSPVIPSMDEFHGSSNKVKEATAVIMLAPDDKMNEENSGADGRATWCCIRKLRMGGIDNRAARLYFSRKLGNYVNKCDICSVNYDGTEIKEIKKDD